MRSNEQGQPTSNEPRWTYMGANAMEWAAGLLVFILIGLFANNPARAMPFMLAGWIMTTVTLASVRRSVTKNPDQQQPGIDKPQEDLDVR